MGLDLRHRVPRFFGSLRPGPPTAEDVAWATGWLSEREERLFTLMSNPDQRHAVRVARRVEAALAESPELLDPSASTGVADGDGASTGLTVSERTILAAALLHDVGKNEARLGTYGRTIATLSGVVGGLDLAEIWQERSGFTRKVGLYLRYGIIGAEMLQLAGSDPLVIAWSTEHHLPEDAWTVPVAVGRVLAAADE